MSTAHEQGSCPESASNGQVEPDTVRCGLRQTMQRCERSAAARDQFSPCSHTSKGQFNAGDRPALASLQCAKFRSNDQSPVPPGLCSSSLVTVAKGQFSIELVPFIILGAILLLLFVIIIAGRLTGVQNRGEQEQLQHVVEQVHREVSIAASVNNGYMRNFTLPLKLGSKDYDIGILKNYTVQATTDQFEASIVTFNVSGQPLQGNNLLRKDNDIITLN
ncbi:hypothetical protein HY492_02915 [Candidatus Woesearchaeota archaeon]|nr:hypothetical protein [Candidatus Woesearchaeota archaeon]